MDSGNNKTQPPLIKVCCVCGAEVDDKSNPTGKIYAKDMQVFLSDNEIAEFSHGYCKEDLAKEKAKYPHIFGDKKK